VPPPVVRACDGRHFDIGGRRVVSFVSPSYLGLERHPAVADAVARAVRTWGVTLATPRALFRDAVTTALERELARFAEQPAALVFPSSSHASRDVLAAIAAGRAHVFVDSCAYPTSLDGVRESARTGAAVSAFPHNDADALARLLRRSPVRRKLVVIDGVYGANGECAPLRAIVSAAERYGALVFMDDSHGLGVLGARDADRPTPYGSGGGGLLRFADAAPERVIVAGTLAKALGTPLAFVAGDEAILRAVSAASQTFVHSSPPSIPNVAGARAALEIQRLAGDALRTRLAALVARFRTAARRAGLDLASGWMFPIQSIRFPPSAAAAVEERLARDGIVPARAATPREEGGARVVRFFITALHTAADVDRAVASLAAPTRTRSPLVSAP
jgi:8-amino-7-oxononanoate synthase